MYYYGEYGEEKMKREEINEKIEMMKIDIQEFYNEGIIKLKDYNDLWSKLNDIKVHVKRHE